MINIKVCDHAPANGCSYYRSIGVFSKLKNINKFIKIEHITTVGWNNMFDADILFLERPYDTNYVEAIKYAKDVGVPVWIDFDDFFHGIPDYNPCRAQFDTHALSCVVNAVKLADVVTVTTEKLKEYYGKINENIFVIPNAFNDYNFKFEKVSDQHNLINWRGSRTHEKDLCSVAINMFELSRKYQSWVFNFQGTSIDFLINGLSRYAQQPEIDIIGYFKNLKKIAPAIMQFPLVENYFNLCKSNIAWIEGTSAGAAMIAPDLPEFQKPGIVNYKNDKIDKNKKIDFFDHKYSANDSYGYFLEKLIKSKSFRQKQYIESFEYIHDNLLLSHVNKQRIDIIDMLIDPDTINFIYEKKEEKTLKNKGNFTACVITVVRNDHDLIEFFYKYWYNIGIEDFFVMLHMDLDDSLQQMIVNIAKVLKNSKFRIFKNNNEAHNHEVDCKILSDAALAEGFDWICGCDIDELLILKKHDSIYDFLKEYNEKEFCSLHFKWHEYRILENTPEDVNPFTFIKYKEIQAREQTKAIGKFNDRMAYVPGIHYIEYSPDVTDIDPDVAFYAHFGDRNKDQFVLKYEIQHVNWMRKYGQFSLHDQIVDNPFFLQDVHWPNSLKSFIEKKENGELVFEPLDEKLFEIKIEEKKQTEVEVPKEITIFKDMALAHKYCIGSGIEIGAAAHNPFNLKNCLNVAPKVCDFFNKHQIDMCGNYAKIDKYGDAENLPFSNESLDYVLSSHVLEHVPNPIAAFLEWNRVLKYDGIVFIIVPKRDALKSDSFRNISTIDDFENAYISPPTQDKDLDTHLWVFSLDILIKLVDLCNNKYGLNWEILETEGTDSKVGNGQTIVCRKK